MLLCKGFCFSVVSLLLSCLLFVFNVDFAEHVSAATDLLFSCVIELLTCSRVSRMADFCTSAAQILVPLFTLRSTTLSMRPHWRNYLQSLLLLLLGIKLVLPNKSNHSTGCRKSRGVKQVWVDGKNPGALGCKWPQGLLIPKEQTKKKTKHQKSAVDFRKTSNGWTEFLSINRIPFLFQIATQNETVLFLKLNIFSFQHWNLSKLCVCCNRRRFLATHQCYILILYISWLFFMLCSALLALAKKGKFQVWSLQPFLHK